MRLVFRRWPRWVSEAEGFLIASLNHSSCFDWPSSIHFPILRLGVHEGSPGPGKWLHETKDWSATLQAWGMTWCWSWRLYHVWLDFHIYIYIHTHIHTCIHAYIHVYIYIYCIIAYMYIDIYLYIVRIKFLTPPWLVRCKEWHIHTYIHTCIHTYIQT